MSDQSSSQGNSTSVWDLIKGHIDTMVDRAMSRSHIHVIDNSSAGGRFKLRFKNFLEDPLNHLRPDQSSHAFHTLHQEINGAVEKAVDTAMSELNVTLTDSSEKESFVEAVDGDIENDVYNAVLHRIKSQEDSSFFESLSLKDETVFVALVSIGVIIPIIFFTLLFIFFYKRYRETKKRSREMLLRDQPDLCMDEYEGDDKCRPDDEVPDLDLKHLRI